MSEEPKEECEHFFIPVKIEKHATQDRMIVVLVCLKCLGHKYRTSKEIKQ